MKADQRGFIPIALAIIIAVLAVAMVGVSIYYKVATDKDADNGSTNQVVVNTNTTNQNANTNAVPSNWQTYTVQTMNISFKYPTGFEVKEQGGNVYIAKGGVEFFATGSNNSFLSVIKNRSYFDEDISRLTNKNESIITIDGGQYKKVIGDDYGRYEGDSAGKIEDVLLNNSMIHIEQRPGNVTQSFDVLATANQILSTFLFLDQTAGWKTYTSTTLDYSIKYPQDWILDETMGPSTIQILPPNYKEVSSLEMTPAVFIKDLDKMLTDELTTDKRDVTINGISAKRQIEHGFAAYNYTYFPKSSRFISVHWADLFSDDYPQYETILSTFQFFDTTAGWKTYTNNTIGVSFEYSNQLTTSNYDLHPETGRATQIRFLKSSGDVAFRLDYNTSDYTRGTETWITERSGRITANMMASFCAATLPMLIVKKNCQVTTINGKNTARLFSEIDSLGGDEVHGFFELFFFETGKADYPVGVISMEFPVVNQYKGTAIATNNSSAIDAVYATLINKTADAATNSALTEFDHIVSTFQFTQ